MINCFPRCLNPGADFREPGRILFSDNRVNIYGLMLFLTSASNLDRSRNYDVKILA